MNIIQARVPVLRIRLLFVATISTIIGVSTALSGSSNVVQIRVNDATYKIPVGYFSAALSAGLATRQSSFTLLLLLPDLEPPTIANSSRFDLPGWHDQIRISLTGGVTVLSYAEQFKTFVQAAGIEDKRQVGPAGSRIYRSYRDMRDYYAFGDERTSYFLSCRLYEDAKFPYCTASEMLASGGALSYSFSRNYVDSARQVDEKVHKLISELRATGSR